MRPMPRCRGSGPTSSTRTSRWSARRPPTRPSIGVAIAVAFAFESGQLRYAAAFNMGGEIRFARKLIERGVTHRICSAILRASSGKSRAPRPPPRNHPLRRSHVQHQHCDRTARLLAKEKGEVQLQVARRKGCSTVPDWVYTSPADLRARDRAHLPRPTWNFVALEAEIPEPRRLQALLRRADAGGRRARRRRLDQRVREPLRAPRRRVLPRRSAATRKEFVCPYHQWSYDLKGNLQGVPFRRGVKGEGGGMPKDFRNEEHGLRKLDVTTHHGVVFASFGETSSRSRTISGPRSSRTSTRSSTAGS